MLIIPWEFLHFLGTIGEDCICAESWVLIDPIFTEVDYVILSGLEMGAGFTGIQTSDYYLPISFMDAPTFLCVVASVWLFGKRSLYLDIVCVGWLIWDKIWVRVKGKVLGRSKGVCSIVLDAELGHWKTGLGKALRSERLAQVDLQKRCGWVGCVRCRPGSRQVPRVNTGNQVSGYGRNVCIVLVKELVSFFGFIFYSYNYIESWNGLGLKGPSRSSCSNRTAMGRNTFH